MRGTTTPGLRISMHSGHRAGWRNLAWKLLLAALIFLLMLVGIPLSPTLLLTLIQLVLLGWGALFAALVAGNLFASSAFPLRWAWRALSVGAYLALAVPAVRSTAPRMLDALVAVAALSLSAHLGRRDLPAALRDWAIVMGLSLYTSLGIMSMWLVVSNFGLAGPVALLLPSLLVEVVVLLLRRAGALEDSVPAHLLALAVATAFAVLAFSYVLLNPSTPLLVTLIFDLLIGLLVGGALMVSWLTRRLIEPVMSTPESSFRGVDLGRPLINKKNGPMLIAMAIYVPLRLLGLTMVAG